jgi:hypothetical protein
LVKLAAASSTSLVSMATLLAISVCLSLMVLISEKVG